MERSQSLGRIVLIALITATGGGCAATGAEPTSERVTGGTDDPGTSDGGADDPGTNGGGPNDPGTTGGSADGSGGATAGGNGGASAGGYSGDGGTGANTSGDPPYANVTAVTATAVDGGYELAVSVESADINCSQYADWWEVLDEDGSLLFRRILEHSHTDANGTSDADAPGNTFTRAGGPVPIAADRSVFVRAHMNSGGYHGQVMRGSAESGFTAAPDIGDDYALGVEDDEPQPAGCRF
ncbi:MAG: hypothetical protein JW751_16240 [Polyangiaceae bacterium]|nr:hypothetical protein [Polyangiaceae bacterium]